jgi:guanine deaminase
MNKDFMMRALMLAQESVKQHQGGPFGAVIVKDDNVIGEGFNQVTSWHDPTAHAEIVAIRHAAKNQQNFDLSNCTLYTSCEPCPMCLAAAYWAKISTIYYANSKEQAAEIGFIDEHIYQQMNVTPENRTIKMQRIDIDGRDDAFQLWQNNQDKTEY